MSRFCCVTPSEGLDVTDRKACFLSLLAQAPVWLRELRVSQHFSTFYGPSVQAMETQLGARHRRRTLTIHRSRAQRTISAGSWFGQGWETLPEPAQQIREERKHASTTTLQHAR